MWEKILDKAKLYKPKIHQMTTKTAVHIDKLMIDSFLILTFPINYPPSNDKYSLIIMEIMYFMLNKFFDWPVVDSIEFSTRTFLQTSQVTRKWSWKKVLRKILNLLPVHTVYSIDDWYYVICWKQALNVYIKCAFEFFLVYWSSNEEWLFEGCSPDNKKYKHIGQFCFKVC